MKVSVIGAGSMGSTFVKQLHTAGHKLSTTAADATQAAALAAQFIGVRAIPAPGAASDADVVSIATGYVDAVSALCSVGDLYGKLAVHFERDRTSVRRQCLGAWQPATTP